MGPPLQKINFFYERNFVLEGLCCHPCTASGETSGNLSANILDLLNLLPLPGGERTAWAPPRNGGVPLAYRNEAAGALGAGGQKPPPEKSLHFVPEFGSHGSHYKGKKKDCQNRGHV
jgi:hypothetical protein